MTEKTATSQAGTAYGQKLDTPISYDYKWTVYDNITEVKAANDLMTDDEVVKVRNTERQNNARQKALQAAYDAAGIVKPTAENNEQIRLRDMFKTLMTAKLPNGERKYTEEVARTLAAELVGAAWATE